MKRAQLERHLEREGCERVRHGSRHDVWRNAATGGRSTVPRHREIPSGTARAICRDLGVDLPAELG